MHKRNQVLRCFSPPVMLATLLIETALGLYVLWRYKLSVTTKLIATFLFTLAIFQMAEYHVCTGIGSNPVAWSKLGFVAITALPPMGLHLLHRLAKRPEAALVKTAYLTMLGFMAFFILTPTGFSGHQCTGNYVIFQFAPKIAGAYSAYYYGWLAVGIGLSISWAKQAKQAGQKFISQYESLTALLVGYLIFLVPTGVANSVKPETRQGIPSIMCGFAVLLALILALYIAPRALQKRQT